MVDNYLVKYFSSAQKSALSTVGGKWFFFFFYGEQTILDPAGLVRTALTEVKGNFWKWKYKIIPKKLLFNSEEKYSQTIQLYIPIKLVFSKDTWQVKEPE